MFKRILFLLFWTFTSYFTFGNTFTNLNYTNIEASIGKDSCDLPAPINFHVEDLGYTWVKLAWTPATPGAQHRVKTYTVIGNILVSNLVVPGGQQNVTVTGLTSGVAYYSTINALCADGTDSNHFAPTLTHTGVITELIVTGFYPINSSATCTVNSLGEYCEFPIDGSTNVFQIQPTNSSSGRQFQVIKNLTNAHLSAITSSNSGDYLFKIDGNWPNSTGVPGLSFQAYYNSTLVATFQLYEHTEGNQTVGRLIWSYASASSYEIVRLTAGPNGFAGPSNGSHSASPSQERGDTFREQIFLASPNPFSASLDVFPARPSAESITLQLFNLSGQKVLDQQFIGGQDQYSLSTANLSPGFYMLRIEADGEAQTLKVVKSE